MSKLTYSLKWLEVFELVARNGSVRQTAQALNLSVSTTSHHLQRLEASVGVALLDHAQRPMVLTPAGEVFLTYVEDALRVLRQGEVAAVSGVLKAVQRLRLAMVDDFDAEIAPELARFLADTMPNCRFVHATRPSHDILASLRDRSIDVGIMTRPQFDEPGLIEYPILRDPFVVALPRTSDLTADDLLSGKSGMPFLRYSDHQMIGAMIEAQLRRLRISLPNRLEFENNQSVMGLVASGNGWTITTPTNYQRARRFHEDTRLLPFPDKAFARYISLFTGPEYAKVTAVMISDKIKELAATFAVDPVLSRDPWLEDSFKLQTAPAQLQ